MDNSTSGFSKGTFTKLGRQGEVTNFVRWINQFQLSERTIELYAVILSLFLKRREINQETINLFLKKHPRDAYKSTLRYYFKYKGWNYELLRLKVPKKKIRDIPDRETLCNILDNLGKIRKRNEQVFWVIILLFNTGARIHEVLNLKLENIDFQENKIRFKTKGEDYREVEIKESIIKEMETVFVDKYGLLAGERLFFRKSKTSHISYVTYRKFIYGSDFNEKEKRFLLRTHDFRRSAINFILKKTGNIVAAKEFSGQRDIRTTMRYVSELEKGKQAKIGNKVILDE